MYCRVFACDFDGTGASDGHLAPELAAALARAREDGITTLLATGRLLEDVVHLCPDGGLFDAIVAENGAVISFASRDRTIQVGTPPPPAFLADLRRKAIPFHVGAVVVGTWDSHTNEVVRLIRKHGLDAQIIFNRSALMILPSGVNKAVGIQRALDELGRSHHNLVAFGDAENDLPMLELAAVGVAARDSLPAVEAIADAQIRRSGGAGVARFIHAVLDAGSCHATPARHRIYIGLDEDGELMSVPSSGSNFVISGTPRSGKSWLAGMIAEQLLAAGLQLCIIDPEGDYGSIGDRPRVLVFGSRGVALPEPAALPWILRDASLSVVLDLANLSLRAQVTYVDEVLAQVESVRGQTGLPHWVLVDEAHNFFHEGAGANQHVGTGRGNFILVTYRPSLVAERVFDATDAYMITGTDRDEERYFLTRLLQARGPEGLVVADALAAIEPPRVGMLRGVAGGPTWRLFTPERRTTPHAHHAHKYLDVQLADECAFHFLRTGWPNGLAAHNIAEFHHAVGHVPSSSLRHHLGAGDFSRWAMEILGDRSLATSLRKLERTVAVGGSVDRAELLSCLQDAYSIESAPES